MSRRERAEFDIKKHAAKQRLHRAIKFRNRRQEDYYNLLCAKQLVFATGPAGTGKTFCACSRAVELLARGDVGKIILIRPAVESEENLGFLPGTVEEKLDPYMLPLYDNLNLACNDFDALQEYLEIAPLAYMRGRTLTNCCVLVDEAQNMTPDQMLMLLTRLGNRCWCFIMGDPYQNDLIALDVNGLDHGVKKMSFCPLVGVAEFTTADVVRSKLVQAVYEYWFAPETE